MVPRIVFRKVIVASLVVSTVVFLGWLVFRKTSLFDKLTGRTVGMNYFLTGSDFKGNYVFGGAMQLAVNELNTNILHGKLQLDLSGETETQRLLSIFNRSEFTTNDLDASSYYVKSGYGQNTVDTINKESKNKFPDKSFGDLSISLSPNDFISYAYFLKQIEYQTAFQKNTVQFLGQNVDGFIASGNQQRKNVQIVEYKNDDNFIVKLNLKDNGDEIYLAKGYDMSNPESALVVINRNTQINTMGSDDLFEAPEIHLNLSRNYNGFQDKYLKNSGFENYVIKVMTENVKFDMDNEGARVENEAYIVEVGSMPGNQSKIKRLLFNKPYWVVMKRANSSNPYFILGVKNTEILGNK